MLFRVLGRPSVVADDGTIYNIDAPRQRALFALLVLRANRVLSTSAAIEGLWGESLPEHPAAALQVVMSRMRRALGPAAERIGRDPLADVGEDFEMSTSLQVRGAARLVHRPVEFRQMLERGRVEREVRKP